MIGSKSIRGDRSWNQRLCVQGWTQRNSCPNGIKSDISDVWICYACKCLPRVKYPVLWRASLLSWFLWCNVICMGLTSSLLSGKPVFAYPHGVYGPRFPWVATAKTGRFVTWRSSEPCSRRGWSSLKLRYRLCWRCFFCTSD